MTERPLAGDLDAAVDPAPGYYPDPSVPGFVRYWGGSAWVPGTSRPAPAAGEPLAPPRGASRRAAATFAPAAPPPRPVVPVTPSGPSGSSGRVGRAESVDETGPVFFDQTSAGASFMLAPHAELERQQQSGPQPSVAPEPLVASQSSVVTAAPEPKPKSAVQQPVAATAWQAASMVQPEPVSWGAPVAVVPEQAPAPVPVPVPVPSPVPEPVLPTVVDTPAPATVPVKPTPRRAAARKPPAPLPAGLGRRVLARLVDTVVLAVVAVAAGVPMVRTVTAHIDNKVTQAELASNALDGQLVRVWLVDGAVLGRIGVLLGILLLAALLYEILPVSRTGQTFGKRLAGIRVVDATVRGTAAPSFGRSAIRWFVRQLALVSVVGLVALLRDRPGHRGWQDRAARTRVVRA